MASPRGRIARLREFALEPRTSPRDDIRQRRHAFQTMSAANSGERRGAMSDPDPIYAAARGAELVRFPLAAKERISFDRLELREIFNLYGRKVVSGEWRDYA